MQKTLLLVSAMLLFAQPKIAASQNCITGEGNIFNETVLIGLNAINTLGANDIIVARASAGCVGQTSAALTNPAATAIALTVWLDDDLTPEVDGVLPGEQIQFYGQNPSGTMFPLVYSLPHEPDGVYALMDAVFDTTLTALLDSLTAELFAFSVSFDSLIIADSTQIVGLEAANASLFDDNVRITARADSLQGLVDSFPDTAEVQALRDGLAAADARIVVLETDLGAANQRIAGILNAFRNIFSRLRNR